VDITDYGDWEGYFLDVVLFDEDVFEAMAEDYYSGLVEYLAVEDFLKETVRVKAHLNYYKYKNKNKRQSKS